MLRQLSALPLAAFAVLTFASLALAGGWAQVTVPNLPTDPPAGTGTTIDMTVLQHGATPVSWPRLTVVATDAVSGEAIFAQAAATGPEGHYTATLIFPNAGDWSLSFQSSDLVMEGTATVSVAPAAIPAVVSATAGPAVDTTALAVALAAVALAAFLGFILLRGGGVARTKRLATR
ncbi:MAG TPA: hypothetical protein VM284_04495 [Candidatus Limnocylindria bacterium]|nr:hypothetical protein [Candidatus Limnocylindria bacterium]